MTSDRQIRLTFGASYDELPLVRHLIRRVLAPLESQVESLYLGAVTEIVVNAIDANPTSTFVVTLELGDRPAVVVTDTGGGFDPPEATSSKSDNLGQGLVIASAVVSDLDIVSTEHGTIVTLPYPLASESIL